LKRQENKLAEFSENKIAQNISEPNSEENLNTPESNIIVGGRRLTHKNRVQRRKTRKAS
jgi:hypothetical protein